MRRIVMSATLLLIAGTAHAQNGCHFKTGNAIVCTDGRNAAQAFANYGFDVQTTNLSYNREILREADCGRAYGKTYATVRIEQISHGRVALSTGWVGVTTIAVDGNAIWYVADGYLVGVCEKYRPPNNTQNANSDYSLPSFTQP